jgi:diaminopimelate epimerase
MRIKFTKMHGAGNDFVVIDATLRPISIDPKTIHRLSDRHRGIGFDQLLVVEAPRRADTDFFYRIFNADGREVAQCGNGARCFARFVRDKELSRSTTIRVETASGIIEPRLQDDGRVTVDMGAPRFEPAEIPFLAPFRALSYQLDVAGTAVEISAISMGNPHAVQIVTDVELAPVTEQGPLIERHARFPQRVNAGYLQVVDRSHARLRVYERGVGETLSCGTGACAAVVAGIQRGLLDSPAKVHTRGGELDIAWAGENQPVFMTGPATTVFEGEVEL